MRLKTLSFQLCTMRKRWIRRSVPVLIFTFFIIVFVNFQLRASSFPKLSVGQRPPLSALYGFIQQVSSAEKHAQSSVYDRSSSSERESKPNENNGGQSVAKDTHATQSKLRVDDIYIAVKTTGRFHKTRLALLLDTWISRTKAHTFIFTDKEDEAIRSKGYNMVVTECQSDHSQQALSCKMSAEYDGFMASGKRWFCHVDDDNYVNPGGLFSLLSTFPQEGDIYVGKPSLDKPITAHELLDGNKTTKVQFWFATGGAGFCLSRGSQKRCLHGQGCIHAAIKELRLMAAQGYMVGNGSKYTKFFRKSGSNFERTSAKIRLPDDCTVGFIVEKMLGISMVHCSLFHSHLENLLLISQRSLPKQVTLSYGMLENKMNSVEVKGSFSKEEDPSRFKTVHCILYPSTSWCPPVT